MALRNRALIELVYSAGLRSQEAVDLDLDVIRRFEGNMMRVARELDRKPALVYRWAKRFGLKVDEFRDKNDA